MPDEEYVKGAGEAWQEMAISTKKQKKEDYIVLKGQLKKK